MAKSELMRELKKNLPAATVANKQTTATTKGAPDVTPAHIPVWGEPQHQHGPKDARLATEEERVESTKYSAPWSMTPLPPLTDLGENIDQLPPLREPMLRLLPQKPGILHVYWILPNRGTVNGTLTLRLCRVGPSGLDVQDEVAVPNARGTWYFHVPESFDNDAALVQLGDYRGNDFIVTMSRGIAHVPGRYASDRTDPAWWINEEDFRHLYQRAGGIAAKQRYVWNNSLGSPTGSTAEGRPQWPGHDVSSSTK